MHRRAVRPHFDQLDDRGTAVQLVRDAPPKPLVQMGPVEQHRAALELGVAQPSRLAGPGSTGDEPQVVDPEGGEGLTDQTARHHVLPNGRRRTDPGTPAHQVGPRPLEDDYVMADPMQQRRRRASGDRSPDNADSHACRPPNPFGAPPRQVIVIRQFSGVHSRIGHRGTGANVAGRGTSYFRNRPESARCVGPKAAW